MNPRIIINFVTDMKNWVRNRGAVFWTIAFPVMLILIFGAIFSGSDEVEYEIYVQDLDSSTMSQSFIEMLGNISFFSVKSIPVEENITIYMEKHDLKRALLIPSGFGEAINHSFIDPNVSVNISFYYDPGEQSSNPIVKDIVFSSIQMLNMNLSGGRNIVGMKLISILTEEYDYIDFFIPGIIGITIMTSNIYGSIERNTKYRKNGVLRKLLTTPITRAEWILSKMLFMLFLSFLSTGIIIGVGILMWNAIININMLVFILIIATSFLFSGLGMIIGRFVKEEETADSAAGAITFPMMFLAGTFFPLEHMPLFLQTFARVLPLYYVNEGLRNAMVYLDFEKAVLNTAYVLVFTCVFFIAGVLLTKWREE